MDKIKAEAILGMQGEYGLSELRQRWRKLCLEFHPDKSASTGMSRESCDEALKDINEAYSTLEPLVKNGEKVAAGQRASEANTRDGFDNSGNRGTYDNQQESLQETHYHVAVLLIASANSAEEYRAAARYLELIEDYKDANVLREKCLEFAARMEDEGKSQKASDVNKSSHVGKSSGWKSGTSGSESHTAANNRQAQAKPKRGNRDTAGQSKAHVTPQGKKYAEAKMMLDQCATVQDYYDAAQAFGSLGDYRDARQLKYRCLDKCKEMQKQLERDELSVKVTGKMIAYAAVVIAVAVLWTVFVLVPYYGTSV